VKIYELKTKSKMENIKYEYRSFSDFKTGYQPRTDIVKEEKDDLVTDCHSILTRWRKQFSAQTLILFPRIYDMK
jgi:predicted nucleic acid-binding Zn ribbon protein